MRFKLVSKGSEEPIDTIDASQIGIVEAKKFFMGVKRVDEKEFDKLAHGIDEYNAYKFGITESSRLDNLPTAPSSNSYELDILSHSLDLLHNI